MDVEPLNTLPPYKSRAPSCLDSAHRLLHALPYPVFLVTIRAAVHLIMLRSMRHLLVLLQDGPAGI